MRVANDSSEYIREMASQLRTIAAAEGKHMLAYLLEMVVEEADDARRQARAGDNETTAGDGDQL
jgi:hypothetical protein